MSADPARPLTLSRPDGATIAYHQVQGRSPTVVFCGGFRSDMTGTKAMALDAWARRTGQAFVRFDYFAHGQSSGAFRDGTVGRWLDDSLAVVDTLTQGPLVLVGSSMGGWLSLLVARHRPARVAGWIGIAAAPDFTEDLMLAQLGPQAREKLQREGELRRPSRYSDEPDILTWRLIEEGRHHLVLRTPLRIDGPVHLFHGLKDPDVPWDMSQRLLHHIEAPDVAATFTKDGDHRLSTPADIDRLLTVVSSMCR
ncbi:carboxylesterase [Reyranella sp. CPCC 100927]|uniref:alpha/beta hydrolase n=1 Tax=Reyranella sp. CPCC 100927 TaxID=2599616 RepID=UPI0011B81A6A|nr:alpha/beta hydrolase [Reyranella sp. CPCC 100927]TWT15091.1 alpha/beta hydrolase [Reyranella sp. CPCC 100927]